MSKYLYGAELAAAIREDLKRELPDYKFSVTKHTYSGGQSIDIRILSGPAPAYPPGLEQKYGHGVNHYQTRDDEPRYEHHPQYGYHVCNNGYPITEEIWWVIKKVREIDEARNYDRSDVMTDYFDVNHYLHVSLGRSEKPYVVKGK